MTKKWIAAGLVLVLSVGLMAGCGNSDSASEATTEAPEEESALTAPVDYSTGYNDDGTVEGGGNGKYVTLCEYSGIEVPREEVEVGDDEVQEQVDYIMANYETTDEITDRAVADGDVVNIDYVGTLDGEEFDGGSAEGYDLTIGSGTFIDNFEEQLIDVMPGDTVEVAVTFPEDYSSEDLAGQDAVFTTTVNYISETVIPDLTDDFVEENLEASYGYTSVDDMNAKIKETLETDNLDNYVWDYVVENSEIETLPEDMVNTQVDVLMEGIENNLTSQGISMDDYIASIGYEDEQDLRDEYYSSCEEMLGNYLVADALAKEMKLSATEEEMDNFFLENYNTDDYSDFIEYYTEPYVKRIVINYIVTKELSEEAEIVD